jgi:hypothetical protein
MSSIAVTHQACAVFARDPVATLRAQIESSLGEQLSSTLLFRERVSPPTVSTGIAALDALTGGLPRGALSEFSGSTSSGRTGAMMAALAEATQRQEVCALVDASDSFDPASAAAAGVNLARLLWVRCNEPATIPTPQKKALPTNAKWVGAGFAFSHSLEQVLKVTDLLLQGGGFGMVVLDLGDIPAESARRIPLTSWFRFRRTVEPTATVLLLVEQEPCANTCASLLVRLHPVSIATSGSAGCCLAPQQSNRVFPGSKKEGQKTQSSILPPSRFARALAEQQTSEKSMLPHIPQNNPVSHADLFRGMCFRAELVRSGVQRKSPQSANIQFELRTAL